MAEEGVRKVEPRDLPPGRRLAYWALWGLLTVLDPLRVRAYYREFRRDIATRAPRSGRGS